MLILAVVLQLVFILMGSIRGVDAFVAMVDKDYETSLVFCFEALLYVTFCLVLGGLNYCLITEGGCAL